MTSESGTASHLPTAAEPSEVPSSVRRLTRSRSDRWVAGVAGGLGEYFGIDTLLVRVAFILLALISGGVAVPFYILAAFIIPDDRSDAVTARRGGGAIAGVVVGLLLVGVGVIWLLAALDVQVPRWDLALSAALIGVGTALVITAGRAGSSGFVFLGLVMTVVLSGMSSLDMRVDSAFSEREVRPNSVAALEPEYSHAFGSFTLDLTAIDIPEGTTRIRVANAFGDTRVRLPAGADVKVDASTFFGETRALNRTFSGIATSQSEQTPDYERATHRLEIEVNTAFGSTEVRR